MKTFFTSNYHSHTKRCGHAFGEDEEFLLAGKEAGFKLFGFSDHVILPDISQPGMRGAPYLLDDYCASILNLKQKYKGDIDVHLGFEAEWYGSRYESYYRDELPKHGVEYLILGQHCFLKGNRFTWYGDIKDRYEMVEAYCSDLIQGMESGLFLYVCHPDLIVSVNNGFDDRIKEVAYRIAVKSKELNLPLEVNMGPSTRDLSMDLDDTSIIHYPYPDFWDIVGEVGGPCVVGVDAHLPSIYQMADYDKFAKFIERHHLNMVQSSNLIEDKLKNK